MQRREAWNSTGVLTRLAGSEAMHVFLRDSIWVLSRPAGSEETPEMKTYTLKIFNSRAKQPFLISKHCDQVEIFSCLTELEKGWTMSVHGVSGEAKVTCTMNRYSLKIQGPLL